MCGIVGVLNVDTTLPIQEDLLLRMRETMLHRGPDDGGIWISKNGQTGLAHRRLSIVDLSPAGLQPMCNEDGSIWIVFNGEIYNHTELRTQLERMGHIYRSHSDTETLIHAYEAWGTDAVSHIEGMFAFALWDEPRQRLWLVRDRMGKKPLYFAQSPTQFLFASEIKALLIHPSIQKEMDEQALWHYLSFAATPSPLTLFKNIYKLPPGTHLLVSQEKTAPSTPAFQWTFTEYWRPWQPTDSPPQNLESYSRKIRALFQKSVERRLMSDVPFGVFLSGGVDSSANVAVMSRLLNRPVQTFSVGFQDQAQQPHNEIHYARQVAQLFKTQHHEILISDDHFLNFLDDMVDYQDEPLSDPVCIPLYHVSKLARSHGTIVIQVGEGSDEIFAGYEIYRNYLAYYHRYWKPFSHLPRWAQSIAAACLRPLLGPKKTLHLTRAVRDEPVFLGAALAFYDHEKSLAPLNTPLFSSATLASWAYQGKNPSFELLSNLFPKAHLKALPPISSESDFLKQMIFWECHQRLAELLLMRLDKMMMATSVEGRAPFLDRELVELSFQVPSQLKISNGIGKAVLKKAFEDLLPSELIYRRKVGFCGGSGNMLTPRLFEHASHHILKTLSPRGWNRHQLTLLLENHKQGFTDQSFRIWNLLNLALWINHWKIA